MKKIVSLLVVIFLAAGGLGFWYWQANGSSGTAFRTVAVERGPFLATIGATGTIQPQDVIDVGAQVAGRIDRFGLDPRGKIIDYSSPVEEGTILAQLDPSLYQARVDKTRADLERSKADLVQLEAKNVQADRDWGRAQDLYVRKSISQADYDLARANSETAQANIFVGKAAIAQAAAALKEAEINLGYTTIRSPVKGVIVDRRVNIGQTVVVGLNAPSLFLIAKDLKKLQVWASVNEADIGQIRPDQEVRFNVDAFPNEVFVGQVASDQPRLNASMTQNVVIYTVVVNTDNSSGRLLPYQTANLQFVAHQRSDALLVPNAALRWRPRLDQVAPDIRKAYAKALAQKQKTTTSSKEAQKAKDQRERGAVWVADNGYVRPLRVQIGSSDGSVTEILGGDLTEGMEVVIGEEQADNNSSETNPFTPKMFGGKKPQQ